MARAGHSAPANPRRHSFPILLGHPKRQRGKAACQPPALPRRIQVGLRRSVKIRCAPHMRQVPSTEAPVGETKSQRWIHASLGRASDSRWGARSSFIRASCINGTQLLPTALYRGSSLVQRPANAGVDPVVKRLPGLPIWQAPRPRGGMPNLPSGVGEMGRPSSARRVHRRSHRRSHRCSTAGFESNRSNRPACRHAVEMGPALPCRIDCR